MEPPGDGEPLPDARVTVDDVELRSLLAISLRPSAFPGDRARLLAVAEEEHAEDRILGWLSSLPATQTFANVEAVWEALGGAREQRNASPMPAGEPAPVLTAATDESIVGRVQRLAVAGIELAVGLVIEAVVQVRRRL